MGVRQRIQNEFESRSLLFMKQSISNIFNLKKKR